MPTKNVQQHLPYILADDLQSKILSSNPTPDLLVLDGTFRIEAPSRHRFSHQNLFTIFEIIWNNDLKNILQHFAENDAQIKVKKHMSTFFLLIPYNFHYLSLINGLITSFFYFTPPKIHKTLEFCEKSLFWRFCDFATIRQCVLSYCRFFATIARSDGGR